MAFLTISVAKSGLSVGFFLRQMSTKSLMWSENNFFGNFGGGWLTIYSKSSKMAIGFIPGDLGVLGVLGFGTMDVSSRIWGPNNWTKVDVSGAGMGYIPKLILRSDRPKDHNSLATEYSDPWNKFENYVRTKCPNFGWPLLTTYRIHFIYYKSK